MLNFIIGSLPVWTCSLHPEGNGFWLKEHKNVKFRVLKIYFNIKKVQFYPEEIATDFFPPKNVLASTYRWGDF